MLTLTKYIQAVLKQYKDSSYDQVHHIDWRWILTKATLILN